MTTINLTAIFDDNSPQSSAVPSNPRTQLAMTIGADVTVNMRVLTPAGAQASLSGATFVLTVKKIPAQDIKLQKTGAIVGGAVQFTILPADTKQLPAGQYIYDVWMTQGGVRTPVMPLSPFQLLATVTPPP